MMAKPRVLLLDEPSLGIAPKLVNQIFSSIKNINKEKKAVVTGNGVLNNRISE